MTCVLVVDDDELIRSALRAILERKGVDVCEAKDGVEGLAQIRHRMIDLIFVDIFMPTMDGFEFIRALRKTHGTVPVAVMSGMNLCLPFLSNDHQPPDYLRMARALGAVHTLKKPFSQDELWDVVDACLSPNEGECLGPFAGMIPELGVCGACS
ncbi:response regulator [Breoghania sp.]|uniref:response regulator n=1 Tax=Breoghania sp. TaxID=2065378 RepID=UPI002AA70891|nr:response regulator [Breoghania sp.]